MGELTKRNDNYIITVSYSRGAGDDVSASFDPQPPIRLHLPACQSQGDCLFNTVMQYYNGSNPFVIRDYEQECQDSNGQVSSLNQATVIAVIFSCLSAISF